MHYTIIDVFAVAYPTPDYRYILNRTPIIKDMLGLKSHRPNPEIVRLYSAGIDFGVYIAISLYT